MRRHFLLFFFILHSSFFILHFDCFAQEEPNVRVLILKGVSSFELYVNGGYKIQSVAKENVLKTGKGINGKVSADAGGINISNELINEKKIIIFPESGVFYLNNRPLRGGLIIKKESDSVLSLINYISLEDYVRGVLFHEVSHHWLIEAIKAQAVATRTYVVYQAEVSKDKDYDVTSDIYSQVYGGKDAERYRTNKAAEETEGLVLVSNGKIFPAYFHATCGGKTEDAAELWQTDLPCLKGVDCGFCIKSKHFKWKVILTKNEIISRLGGLGCNLSSLEGIQILERDKSNRIRKLKLRSRDAETIISAKDFRQALGGRDIRSTNFELMFSGNNVSFEGFGWGHGVGMCQWGAYFMSIKKYKFSDILKYYYPGVKIISLPS